MTISMKQAPLLQRREQETPIEIETGTAPESPKLSQPVRNWSVAPHCLVTTIWLSLLYASVLVFLVEVVMFVTGNMWKLLVLISFSHWPPL